MPSRKRPGNLFVSMVSSAAMLWSLSARGAEFKATVTTQQWGQAQTLVLFVKGPQFRLEGYFDGKKGIILVDSASKKVAMLDQNARQYHATTTENPLLGFVDPLAAVDAAAMNHAVRKEMGTESVNGFLCGKYALSTQDGSSVLMNYWIATKLGFLVKIVQPLQGGMTMEVTHIQ